MAVIPKTLHRNVVQGEMEKRQTLARGYKIGPKSDKRAILINHKKPYLYPKGTAEEATKIGKEVVKRLLKPSLKSTMTRYLKYIYIPFGALAGMVAVIGNGIGAVSPYVALFVIVSWVAGYFVISRM